MSSKFGTTFMFLTKLAWQSRITLPALITCAFMALNFRWEVEINIHTERIVFQEGDPDAESFVSDESWESFDDDDDDVDTDTEEDGVQIGIEYAV